MFYSDTLAIEPNNTKTSNSEESFYSYTLFISPTGIDSNEDSYNKTIIAPSDADSSYSDVDIKIQSQLLDSSEHHTH